MSKEPPDYEVGYGKPPKEHQFPKGQSGNKKGRPKKKKEEEKAFSAAELALKIMREEVAVQVNGEEVTMTKLEALIQQQLNKALRGDSGASREIRHLMKDLGISLPTQVVDDRPCGVLVVGETLTQEEWEEKFGGRKELPELDLGGPE
jgi:hypothetical protein